MSVARKLVGLAAAVVLAACSSSSDGAPEGTPFPGIALSGVWEIGSDVTSNDPDCEDFTTVSVVIVQDGGRVTVTSPAGTYSGVLNGDTAVADVPFSYPEDGGITTVAALTFRVVSNVEIQGQLAWSWSDGSSSCSGTTTFNGYRIQ